MIPIDAPIYLPASVFEQPAVAPRALSVRNYSTAELMQMPSAWAVVTRHMPAIRMIVDAEQAKPSLSTMTLGDFAQFGSGSRAVLDLIDAELAQLPAAGATR